ncbi:MAG: DUF4252 domain-containing protein [Aureispira sp.]
MKGFLILLSLLSCFSWVQAQNKTINDFYKTHRKGEDAVGMRIPGWMVQIGMNISAGDKESREELKPLRPFLRRLNNVRMLSVDGGTKVPKAIVQNFVRTIQKHDFSTLARIKQEETRVDILIRVKERGPKKNRRNIVKNIILLVQDEGELNVFTVSGRWHMGQVNKILKERQVQELWTIN